MGLWSIHIVSSKSVMLVAVFVIMCVLHPLQAQDFFLSPSDTTKLTRNELSTTDQTIYITDSWKFQAGDDYNWSSPDFADTSWQKVSTYLGPSELPFIEWQGIGWFRIHLDIDSSLVGYPLALLIEQHHGASEIYLDGRLLYQLGEVSMYSDDFIPYRDARPRPLVFTEAGHHVMGVRYANHLPEEFIEHGFTPGFRFLIGDLNFHIEKATQATSVTLWTKMFYAGILLSFSIIHLLLFIFYPTEKRNLYFAVFTGFLAILTYSIIEIDYTNQPLQVISFFRISLIAWLLTVVYALRFTYSLFYEKLPKVFWVFSIVAIVLAIGTWNRAQNLNLFRQLFVFLILLEILRVLLISFFRKKPGVWVIGTGLFCFVAGILYTVLTNLDIITGEPELGNLYGSVALILGMSIYLSRDFSRTNKRLEYKLREVKQLSERSLEQERISKQKEIERKLLEVENKRKSSELEEARALQLSMLPKHIPESKYWDISVFMETAQEVGGDYYDFAFDKNDVMTIALGDATGHGMKAGIMVATAKSYFHTLANEQDTIEILKRMSSGIRNMDLRMMYMSMLFLKCDGHSIQYTAAGMPPILYFNAKEKAVTKHLLKGMPLGTRVDFPYASENIQVLPDDVLLLMSDGLMELFNQEREILGVDRIGEVLQKTAGQSASEILDNVKDLAVEWADGAVQEDDITIMVLKAKNYTGNA